MIWILAQWMTLNILVAKLLLLNMSPKCFCQFLQFFWIPWIVQMMEETCWKYDNMQTYCIKKRGCNIINNEHWKNKAITASTIENPSLRQKRTQQRLKRNDRKDLLQRSSLTYASSLKNLRLKKIITWPRELLGQGYHFGWCDNNMLILFYLALKGWEAYVIFLNINF